MSFWVEALCYRSVADVTPADLLGGIEPRLSLLTYLFCPDDEGDPREVLRRLRIENGSKGGTFESFAMYYRPSGDVAITIRRSDRGSVDEFEQETLPTLKVPGIDEIRRRLAPVSETVSFCLKAHHVRGMGFPLAIAGAAYLVERAGGLIQSGTYSWMVPSGREVDILLEVDD